MQHGFQLLKLIKIAKYNFAQPRPVDHEFGLNGRADFRPESLHHSPLHPFIVAEEAPRDRIGIEDLRRQATGKPSCKARFSSGNATCDSDDGHKPPG